MIPEKRKRAAEKILRETGLLERLGQIGAPHVIGSCRMDMMAWNDLDIDVQNENMSLEKLHALTGWILERFRPFWYEAKQSVDDKGRTVWFHGFEAEIAGEVWNFDIWFFDAETIRKAEEYCDGIARKCAAAPGSREKIIEIKQELIRCDLYGFEKYTSMDVYRAVLEQGIGSADELLDRYIKGETKCL